VESATVSLSPEDHSLLIEVLERNQSMYLAAHAAKLIEQELSYPIPELGVIIEAFTDREFVQVHTSRVTREQVERYLPPACFPIDNRRMLVSRLIMAFERERMSVIARLAQEQGHPLPWEVKDV
jgi:hypothetical protein